MLLVLFPDANTTITTAAAAAVANNNNNNNDILKKINLFILFIYFWLCWVFVAACRLSLVWRAGATLPCGARASHCSGFSCCRARALGAWASVVVACGLSSCGSWALERRLSSCGTEA